MALHNRFGRSTSNGMQSMSSSAADPNTSHSPRVIQCPFCNVEVKSLVSRTRRNPDRPFLKCPYYQLNPRCKFYIWEDEYEAFLRSTRDLPMQADLVMSSTESDGRIEALVTELIDELRKRHLLHQHIEEMVALCNRGLVLNTVKAIVLMAILFVLIVMLVVICIK